MNPTADPESRSLGTGARLAILLATGFGLGYLPKAPGTWGSLGGVGLTWCLAQLWPLEPPGLVLCGVVVNGVAIPLLPQALIAAVTAVVGVWAAGRAARHYGKSDPPCVVIDEICGQQLAFLGLGPVNWKYLLLGFILFRAFDIWKPFPARRAESWPGGWGIMADDWFAGLYAALGVWLARTLGG